MKQKRISLKEKNLTRDHGKDLYDALLFLIAVLVLLWYFGI